VLEEAHGASDERHWVVMGHARGRVFNIKLTRNRGEPFPYDEAIVKLMVFA
jgi:hypothetical protein